MKKKKYLFLIIISILIIMTYSFFNMYNLQYLNNYEHYLFKQVLWYIIGFIIFFIIIKNSNSSIFKYSFILYLVNIVLLILVLFYGVNINGTRAWFNFKFFSFQPSSLMLLSLSLYLTRIVCVTKIKCTNDELKLILRCILVTIIPSILVFLEPDSGNIFMYLIILFIALYNSKINKRWFTIIVCFIIAFILLFIYLYLHNKELLISLIGNTFFYRIERIISFANYESLQLYNALVSIGTSSLFGYSFGKIKLYIPESATDFIFAISISNFGILGTIIILLCFFVLNYSLICINCINNKRLKTFNSTFIGIFIFSQFVNIFMNIGLLPIMGIPLPFLSYGGTIIIIYFTYLGIILNAYLYGT